MKAFDNFVDKTIVRLGKSNDSEIVTATLAAFKLIFIPIGTLSDKKSTKEQKRYTVTRDLLTESVALTGYIGITKALKNNLTGPICSKYYKQKAKELKNNLSDDEFHFLSKIDRNAIKYNAMSEFSGKDAKVFSDNQKEIIQKLEGIVKRFPEKLQNPKDLYLNTKKTLSHLTVCTLALTLIPFVTNKILEVMSKSKTKEIAKKPDENPKKMGILKPISFTQYAQKTRVGGQNVLCY